MENLEQMTFRPIAAFLQQGEKLIDECGGGQRSRRRQANLLWHKSKLNANSCARAGARARDGVTDVTDTSIPFIPPISLKQLNR